MLTPEEAIDVLTQHAGTVFDRILIQVLEKASGGEKILTDLLASDWTDGAGGHGWRWTGR